MTSKKKTKKRDKNLIPLRLLKQHPDTKAEEWVRAGQGWRHESAEIGDECVAIGENSTIGPISMIGNGSHIGDDVTIREVVTIGEGCLIEDGTYIGAGAEIESGAVIYGYCRIGRNVCIGRGAKIGLDVTIGDGVCVPAGRVTDKANFTAHPLVIYGSNAPVVHAGPRMISIGCQVHTIGWWQKHGRDVGANNGFSAVELAEYELYINLVIARDAVVFPGKKFDRKEDE